MRVARECWTSLDPRLFSVMPLLATDAVVLHVADYLESSRILRLATRECGVQTVVATGVSLNVGIPGVVIEALNHGYHVVLVTDCVAGYPLDYAKQVIEHGLGRITTRATAQELLELWRA